MSAQYRTLLLGLRLRLGRRQEGVLAQAGKPEVGGLQGAGARCSRCSAEVLQVRVLQQGVARVPGVHSARSAALVLGPRQQRRGERGVQPWGGDGKVKYGKM